MSNGNRKIARQMAKAQAKEQKAVFKAALKAGQEMEETFCKAFMRLPFFARAALAFRIIFKRLNKIS